MTDPAQPRTPREDRAPGLMTIYCQGCARALNVPPSAAWPTSCVCGSIAWTSKPPLFAEWRDEARKWEQMYVSAQSQLSSLTEERNALKEAAELCVNPFNNDGLTQKEGLVVLEGVLRREEPSTPNLAVIVRRITERLKNG